MKIRFFFDAGSGVCLWADDDEARDAFGYPIELEDLPLDAEAVSIGESLIRRFDTSLNWDYPSDPSPWSEEEKVMFLRDAADFHSLLSKALGSSFNVVNEVRA